MLFITVSIIILNEDKKIPMDSPVGLYVNYESMFVEAQDDKFIIRAYTEVIFTDEEKNTIFACNPKIEFEIDEKFTDENHLNFIIVNGSYNVLDNTINSKYRILNVKALNSVLVTFFNEHNRTNPFYLFDQSISITKIFTEINKAIILKGKGMLIAGSAVKPASKIQKAMKYLINNKNSLRFK